MTQETEGRPGSTLADFLAEEGIAEEVQRRVSQREVIRLRCEVARADMAEVGIQTGWNIAVAWLHDYADARAGKWMNMHPRQALKEAALAMEKVKP